MKYRNIGMWLSCLCQVWEQQLYSFIIHEAEHEGLKYNPADTKRGFAFTKEAFEFHQQRFEDMPAWNKIKELRLLVNVIKHAEGDSEENCVKSAQIILFRIYMAQSMIRCPYIIQHYLNRR